ncbi:hypothetical protein [Chryseobacterium sp.]|uniref:hypothetical protein n=1 Tax=Chryseobacterium sp. TaxID=1871047 RepID=UPI0025C4A350|nr:hypothetical protein [Chryseobacterium sp.]MBV8326619.1 hypothetical protein [Chryseobacterium sp.]
MENKEEIERQILEIVRKQHEKSAGTNGCFFDEFDHILNLPIKERTAFLEQMAREKKISIGQSLNSRKILLPK